MALQPDKASKRIAKLRALSGLECRTLAAAYALLPLCSLALRLFGLERLKARVKHVPVAGTRVDMEIAVAMGRMVNAAASHSPFPTQCLARSLLLHWMLQRHGLASQLRIGVRLDHGQLDAHAWVELAGQPVNDSGDIGGQFSAFGADPPTLV